MIAYGDKVWIIDHMLSLKTEADVVHEAREHLRAQRMALSWRQEDLAERSGLGVATIRRFERSGRIGFNGFAKLLVTLGLADRFLAALKPSAEAPKDINAFLAAGRAPIRRRAPNRKQ